MAKIIGKADTLKRALAELTRPDAQAADEFTAYDLLREDPTLALGGLRCRLMEMARRGEVTMRKVLIDGKWTNAYRFAAR